MAKMGRPRVEIKEDQFEGLCGIQCTLSEIAGIFKCSGDTIERWCKRTYKTTFAEAFKKYSASGKMSLRRLQFRMAETNATMAIWLGKQYLGQTDKVEANVTETSDEIMSEIAAEIKRVKDSERTEGKQK